MARAYGGFSREGVVRLLLLGTAFFLWALLTPPPFPWTRLDASSPSLRTSKIVEADLKDGDPKRSPRFVPPFYPDLALNQYQTLHSASVLREETNYEHRRFAILHWWCPDRAGNILHNFFNNVIWAIATNRTVLWVYDGETGQEHSYERCARSLHIADWIPSYQEFRNSLPFALEDAVPIPIDVNRWSYDSEHRAVVFPQIPDVLPHRPNITRNQWHDHPMLRERHEYRNYIKLLPQDRQLVMGMLYYQKVDYLLGMLLRACFALPAVPAPAAIGTPKTSFEEDVVIDSTSFSIALHSRHPVIGDDGSFVQEEMDCLQELVEMNRRNRNDTRNAPCDVYLMSDRPKTLRLLSDHARELGCRPMIAPHDPSSGGSGGMGRTEHGPLAGPGFLEDLAFASRARTALVGDVCRSSFSLLVELVTYDRFIEAWRAGKSDIDDLQLCILQNKLATGYSYGPGTPTFAHHTKLPPLQPEVALQEYRRHHSIESVRISTGDRRYLRVALSCDEASIQHFLNGFLFAVLSNRTLVADRLELGTSCRGVLELRSWVPTTADTTNRTMGANDAESNGSDSQPRRRMSVLEEKAFVLSLNSAAVELDFTLPMAASVSSFVASSDAFLQLDDALQGRFRQLTSEGTDYLYGMAFFAALDFSASVRRSLGGSVLPASLVDPSHDDEVTTTPQFMHAVAVDMRIWDESREYSETADCLSSAIDLIPSPACVLYVLVDGSSSDDGLVTKLFKWINESSSLRRCSILTPPIAVEINGTSILEPGTDEAAWWYMARVAWMSSRIRWAYVGPPSPTDSSSLSSSHSLLLQTLQYQRQSELWHQGRNPPIIPWDLSVCRWQ